MRRAHLLATAALVTALAPAVAHIPVAIPAPPASDPTGGALDRVHNVRDAVIEGSHRFYNLADILTGALNYSALPL
ncbi:hypothetical protein GCM10022419_020030 [Nonomuraea rosea]|jgi:hypothetical protein|uniref:Uncharacterized protein n=1 Tax=Nonomuraea rosea TaxID=638574 RepID=A0ABP6VSB8_9ACTN